MLTLRVTDDGNGNGSDHADWADAKLTSLDDLKKYRINVEETNGGTITFTPNSGYVLAETVVNKRIVEGYGGNHVLENVTEDVNISATFVAQGEDIPTGNIFDVAALKPHVVDYGTSFAELDLAATVEVTVDSAAGCDRCQW